MSIQYEDLWNKSKVFIEKAIAKRDESDFSEFQLWASLTLEILGKATLAFVHPSLVVDPNDPKGLLIACKYLSEGEAKTISAKTVYERLQGFIKIRNFDNKTKDFCMRLANYRNAELHSGAIPFEGVTLDSWLPKFWDTCKMMIEFQGKTLDQFIGKVEAIAAEEIIDGRAKALQKSVEARIEKHRTWLEVKYDFNVPNELNNFLVELDDHENLVECPACAFESGIVQGELCEEGQIEYDDEEPWIQWRLKYFDVTGFFCRICELSLNGVDEIKFADLEVEFTKYIEIEPDYEPDYGND